MATRRDPKAARWSTKNRACALILETAGLIRQPDPASADADAPRPAPEPTKGNTNA